MFAEDSISQQRAACVKADSGSALQWWLAVGKKGPFGAAQLYMHSASVVVKGSWLTKAHTAVLKKNLFPPQSEECLSVVSTLPWKHMVWFHCFGCTRGELKEKSYDHRRTNRWLNMWVSSSKCCFAPYFTFLSDQILGNKASLCYVLFSRLPFKWV